MTANSLLDTVPNYKHHRLLPLYSYLLACMFRLPVSPLLVRLVYASLTDVEKILPPVMLPILRVMKGEPLEDLPTRLHIRQIIQDL